MSGKYGIYHNDLEETSHEHYSQYKYVTLGIDNVPSDQIIMARFYIRKNSTTYYADYYNSNKDKFDGCAVNWEQIENA